MDSSKCPGVDALETLAAGRPVASKIVSHVEHCPQCGPAVVELRADAELLAQLREAAADGPDETTHERVLEICARVAREGQPRPE